ncbi:L,D-transpeptidase [Patescibacteria group bacterium]|nr:L,D-transpeptidase [Patescibacteria group bacterium]
MRKYPFYIILAILASFIFPSIAQASATWNVPITTYDQDWNQIGSFTVWQANAQAGFSLAVADLGTDGVPELILGQGLGNEPSVLVYSQSGSKIGSLLAYDQSMKAGLNLAVCDLDHDGANEIITAPQRGGGPHVKIFDRLGNPLAGGDLFVYNPGFEGGVNLACGDLNEDGIDELVTLPAAGGGPHVKIWRWSGNHLELSKEFFAYAADDQRGLVGTIHDGVLHLSTQHASATSVKSFIVHSDPKLISEKILDLPEKGVASIFIHDEALNFSTTSNQAVYNLKFDTIQKIETDFSGLNIVSADLNQNGQEEIISVPARPSFGDYPESKSIVIDLSEQRLYAFQNGILDNTFLISSGKFPWHTPVGNHSVLAKIPYVDYTWNYGANDPRNYSLGFVPYNLRIYPHIYIHYAYWHNNFGHPMSHGCVNVNLENMKWIYDWAEENIPVEVRE